MSRPTKRKTKPTRTRPRREPQRTPRLDGMPSPTPVFETALRSARGIHAAVDPLEAEVFVSALLATFDRPLVDVPDPVDFLGQMLVTFLVGSRSPDTLALLCGIAAVADEPLAASARSAVARLRASGREDPAFGERIGPYRFVDAWTSIDEYGDQEMVAVSFGDPSDRMHTLAFMIDHNFEGLVREAMLGPDLAQLRTTWAETSGMTIVGLDAQALADRLGQGLTMYRLFLDPPCSDEVRELAMLMKTRLRVLPPPSEPEHREVDDDEREALATDFATSKEAGRAAIVPVLARSFIDYRFDHTDGDPMRWSPIAVELCLVDWFPRKVTLDDEDLRAVPDALRRFVRYAGRRKGLSRASVAETLDAVDQFEPQFLAAMRDPSRYGPAKSIADEMLRDGLDLTDERAVASWIEAFNARPMAERDAVLAGVGPGTDIDDDGRYGATDADVVARRRWTIPPIAGVFGEIDAELLDPNDPDDRRTLIELDHPALLVALDDGNDVVIDGARINPRLHIALHEIVANQLWDDDPPETWEAAQRLGAEGHDRHEILHTLAGAVSGVVWAVHQPDQTHDPNVDMRTALRALPGGLVANGGKRKPH